MLMSSRPTVTTRGRVLGSASNTVRRPSGSRFVVTSPRGLWNSHARVRSRCGIGTPSTRTSSPGPTITAGVSNWTPLTATRPAAIRASASRREATPARAMTLATRSPVFAASGAPADASSGWVSADAPGRWASASSDVPSVASGITDRVILVAAA